MVVAWGSRTCGVCKVPNGVQKTITNNVLRCFCTTCGESYTLPLLEIKKKVIYLDQNFFSSLIKDNNNSFINLVVQKLQGLSSKQLIICPYSELHDFESHLISNGSELFKAIKLMSRGKRFYLSSQIKERQILNAYRSFLKKGSNIYNLQLYEAIEPGVHDWTPSWLIDTNFTLTNLKSPSIIREEKELFATHFIEALPKFHETRISLMDLFKKEVRAQAKCLMQNYLRVKNSVDIDEIVNSEELRIISAMMSIDNEPKDDTYKIQQILIFLTSSYFENIPYIHIASGLWAAKIKEIASGSMPSNFEKQKELMRGFSNDIEHMSVFAPYCDAMLTEKTLMKYSNRWRTESSSLYKFNVYSVDNKEALMKYLDSIEDSVTREMKEELKIAYDIIVN